MNQRKYLLPLVAVGAGIGFTFIAISLIGYTNTIVPPNFLGEVINATHSLRYFISDLLFIVLPLAVLAFVFGGLLGKLLKTNSLLIGIYAAIPFMFFWLYIPFPMTFVYLPSIILQIIFVLLLLPMGIKTFGSVR